MKPRHYHGLIIIGCALIALVVILCVINMVAPVGPARAETMTIIPNPPASLL